MDNDIAVPASIGDAKAELFGELKRLFDNAGLSTRAVGKRANCSASTVNRAVNGQTVPSWETLSAIVRELGGDREQVQDMWDRVDQQRRAERDLDPRLQEDDDETLLRATAERLDALRKKKDISIRQLAKRAGYSRSTLHSLLQGSTPPTSDQLTDLLQSLDQTPLEIRSWQARFRYAKEAYLRARQDARAREVPFSPELAKQLQSFRKDLRWNARVAAVSASIAVVTTAIAAIAVIALLSYTADPYIPPSGSRTTNTSTLTPSAVPPIQAYVTLDEGVKIYEQPRIDSTALGIVKKDSWSSSSEDVTVECQVVTAESVTDDETGKSSPIWFKITLDGGGSGYLPAVYVTLRDRPRPISDPPICQ